MKISSDIRCKIIGHNWIYKDCSNAMMSNGEKYEYSKLRKCLRCNKREYSYDEWLEEEQVVSC